MEALDFAMCYQAAYGQSPFPWQARLAAEVIGSGRWPSLLDLPTGAGKTAAIDIALFALATRPHDQPRRVVLVVDRRVVVDQAAQRARKLRDALRLAPDGSALAQWRQRLLRLWEGQPDSLPFEVSVLRGGMPRDEAWASRPDRPAVVVSTVDQVGSRLLFRGYGVSERMAPVHAGLLGSDCLFLLDEVHLSAAFAETLDALRGRWRHWHALGGGRELPDRWAVVSMSATPHGATVGATSFGLSDEDHAHPVLTARLSARKPASLRLVTVRGDEEARRATFVAASADAAEAQLRAGAQVTAVVVNRVATARQIHRELASRLRDWGDCALLTGRMRPIDRMRVLGGPGEAGSLLSRIAAGRERSADARPLVVVATQSIEAGADFDFDALVTECASLDALRQRFGRLDRLGQLGEATGTILARHDQVGERADDPIYGRALAETWAWLEERAGGATVDFGLLGWVDPSSDREPALHPPAVHAPVLLPSHLDAWAQTNPRPYPDPDVALWLHGPGKNVPEVQVVWRADVDADDLVRAHEASAHDSSAAVAVEEWRRRFDLLPPSSLEALSVPIAAARAWLNGSTPVGVGDVEGASGGGGDEPTDATRRRLALAPSRSDVSVVSPDELRPGMTIVVPVSYGGLSADNWDPASVEPVTDVAELAQLLHRGRLVVRMEPEVWVATGDHPADAPWRQRATSRSWPALQEDQTARAFRDAMLEWLTDVVEPSGPLGRAIHTVHRARASRLRLVEIVAGRFALVASQRLSGSEVTALFEWSPTHGSSRLQDGDSVTDIVADGDEASFVGDEITLDRHLQDVAVLAERFARNLGLPGDLVLSLSRAGRLHDAGKADRRFQRWLAGGSEVRLALQEALLAKSSGEAADRSARVEARRRSEYPDGYRHELLSVEMVAPVVAACAPACDADLVLHLIASHHGWCRPLAPATDPGPPLDVAFDVEGNCLRANAAHSLARLDSGVAERYVRLTDRFGWWGLAWLEAILRLADHCASADSTQTPL